MEECEGELLAFEGRCALYQPDLYPGGRLKCRSDCHFDTSECLAPSCGDGKRNIPEQCDGGDVNGHTCASWDGGRYADGELSCNADGTMNSARCVGWVCGNGIIEGDEHCEGSNLNGAPAACNDYDPQTYAGGTLACSSTCRLDTSRCTRAVCGDGKIEANEQCEPGNMAGTTCANTPAGTLITPFGDVPVNFTGGTIRCNAACLLDVSGCARLPGCYRTLRGAVCY